MISGGLRRQTGQLPTVEDDRPGHRALFLTPQWQGEKPFRCHVCGRMLALDIQGSLLQVVLHCVRCKSLIIVRVPAELFPKDTTQSAMLSLRGEANPVPTG